MLTLFSSSLFSTYGRCFGIRPRGMMPYSFGYNPYFFGFGIFKLLVGLGILVLIVYLVIKVLKSKSLALKESNKALEILKERYAKGEIGEEEFKKMRKELLS